MSTLDPRDLDISFFKSSGPGGQKKNKTESAVRIRHRPSGLMVVAAESRSREINRRRAMERLAERLAERNRRRPRRIPTRPGKAVKERRLFEKKRRGEIKRGRGRVDD